MSRASQSVFSVVLVVCLLANALGAPSPLRSLTRHRRDDGDSNDLSPSSSQTNSSFDDNDDDDDFGPVAAPSGGGSNLLSLLNLASALFPSSSNSGANRAIRGMIRKYLQRYQQPVDIRRQDISKNIVDVDYVKTLTPPYQRQEDEDQNDSDSHSEEDNNGDDDNSESEEHNDAAEESLENNKEADTDKASKQDNGNGSGDDGSDYSEEPESDGEGGGILGLLAGLSGGEGGSDLGTLLATVSQIVGDLSGDGFDLNALIGSGFGLFVGLLSQGEENPGEVIASYLLTSLDTITGGGTKNNGAFFGNFLSTLVKGVSAAEDPEGESGESSEEGDKVKMADSAGFFISLLMSLSGDMSATSSAGSSKSW